MQTSITRQPPAAGTVSRRRSFRMTSRALLAITSVHAFLVFVQAVLAGQFLSGNATALAAHEINGTEIITLVALVQAVVATLLWRPGRGPAWPFFASVFLLQAEITQIVFGFEGRLTIHIPLGVAIFGTTLVLLAGTRRIMK